MEEEINNFEDVVREKLKELTRYEKARILGARSLQLAMGAPIMIKLTKKQLEELGYNTLKIAKLELEKGVIPITVKRPSP